MPHSGSPRDSMKAPDTMHAETVQILSRLVRAQSCNPPGDITACSAVICEVLEKEGIGFEVLESAPGIRNVVARLPGSLGRPGTKTLLFNGHLDTVPPGEGWTVDPYGAEVRDGYMYGRGTTDMKAGVAACLMSLVDLKRRGAPFAGTVIFTAVGDEEFHSQYGTKWLLGRGLTADWAINCEPTNLDICLGNRGLIMVDVTVRGKASHGGRPHLGKNAITIALKIVDRLNALSFEGSRDDRFKDPVGSLSVVGLHGGDRINVIPDRCEFYIDRRLMPGEKSQEAIAQIGRAIEEATGVAPAGADCPAADIVMTPEVWHEPFWTDQDTDIVRACTSVYRGQFGREPAFEGKSAGTDASHLFTMGGIPTVIFGPGDYNRSHTVDERVDLSHLLPAVRYYSRMAETLLRGGE
jgi:succinyl-diaminopimelate desuccinylase